MTAELSLDRFSGSVLGLIADAHIHPGDGVVLQQSVLNALRGVDAIVALGDMGEISGLDALARIAPVLAVRGFDDANDARVAGKRVLSNSTYTLGAIFNGETHGLFATSDPFVCHPGLAGASNACFGRPIDVLLCASTHKLLIASSDRILIVNPGSPTLAESKTIAKVYLVPDHVRVEHVLV